MPPASVKADLLQRLLSALRVELRRARRRGSRSPWALAGLVLAIIALSAILHEPRLPAAALAQGMELACTVQSVYDGDTLRARCPDGTVTVRMFGIDAPEMKQEPWGARSRDALRALLPQRAEITLRVRDQDRYGRTVAQVRVGERDAGLELVRQGRAVVYAQYNDSIAYRQAETEARQARRGIWEQAGGQQDPATWRRLNPR
jgi:endonuclease YncB( thermonuclease family)